jgi:putative toxin-antitoxin system antitoxin component (TIGR02293 family)
MAQAASTEKAQAERIHALLGGQRSFRLGKEPTMIGLHEAAVHGLPVDVIDSLGENLGTRPEAVLKTIAVSSRTLARRRKEGVLSAEESDRAVRIARIAALAEDVLGGRREAVEWLRQPNRSLGGYAPLELVRTDAGATMVADVLGRLEYGVFG